MNTQFALSVGAWSEPKISAPDKRLLRRIGQDMKHMYPGNWMSAIESYSLDHPRTLMGCRRVYQYLSNLNGAQAIALWHEVTK